MSSIAIMVGFETSPEQAATNMAARKERVFALCAKAMNFAPRRSAAFLAAVDAIRAAGLGGSAGNNEVEDHLIREAFRLARQIGPEVDPFDCRDYISR